MDTLIARAREAVSGATKPVETIDRLNLFFFEKERFRVTYDLSSADHLLPGRVVEGKRGYCIGLAAVYLILAEELDLPIHAVATPKHMFLRWDDGQVRRNIELFQQGRSVSDEEYIREQKIPQESIKRRVFLTNLSPREFLGFVYQNLGVLESQKENFDASARFYAKALRLNPKLAAAHYNRGNDSLKLKQYRKAIRAYDKALNLYPDDPWALQNRGLARKGIGKMQKAEEDWARVKAIEPGFKSPE
jgi:regulator of sirC expression with transglutaminase-like and TPR domain